MARAREGSAEMMLLLAAALAATADTAAPKFRPQTIVVQRDTVWFADSQPSSLIPVPAIGYVPASNAWVLRAQWHRDTTGAAPVQPSRGEAIHGSYRPGPLPYGFSYADTTPQRDPRYVGHKGGDEYSTIRSAVIAPDGMRQELRIRITGDARRQLYLASGHTLRRTRVPPPFTTELARWAAGDGRIVFAFDSPRPPRPEAPWLPLSDEERQYDHFLSGLLVLDTATRKLTPVLHPRLLEHSYTRIAVAGGALWVVASPTDPDSTDATPTLARYDFPTAAWRFYGDQELPVGRPFTDVASDGRRLYVASPTGVAVLDPPTSRWSVRYFRDSAYLLADGADTSVTRIVAERVAAPTTSTDESMEDSLAAAGAIADELVLRHRTRFIETLLRTVPVDSVVELAQDFTGQRGGRWDLGAPFVVDVFEESAAQMLSRPEFVPYLREALRHQWVFPFADSVLARMGDTIRRAALRATLDSGSTEAAVLAVKSLLERGDSTGVRWLRAKLDDERYLADARRTESRTPPLDIIVRALTDLPDTARLDRMIEIVVSPAGLARAGLGYTLADALLHAAAPPARPRIVLALAEHPSLWYRLLAWAAPLAGAQLDSLDMRDSTIRRTLTHIATRVLTMSDAEWGRLDVPDASGYPAVSRAGLVSQVIGSPWRFDARPLAAALVASLASDTTMLYARQYALVSMTGRDDAPADPRTPAEYSRVAAFWSRWLAEHGTTFTPLSETEGKKALERWSAMHR